MKVVVVIPVISYEALLKLLPIKSPEYAMLKNGVVEGQDGRKIVSILCDEKQADQLRDLIERIAPEFLLAIQKVTLPPDA